MKWTVPSRRGGPGWGRVLEVPLLATPKGAVLKRIKKRNLSEPQASLFRFPFQYFPFWEPAKQASTGGRLSLLPFFGEAKKGSGPPGPVPASLFGEPHASQHRRDSVALDSPLQGAHRLASQYRLAGGQHAVRILCKTLRGNDRDDALPQTLRCSRFLSAGHVPACKQMHAQKRVETLRSHVQVIDPECLPSQNRSPSPRPIHRHHTCPTQPKIVLQPNLRTIHLPRLRLPPQLLRQFITLR